MPNLDEEYILVKGGGCKACCFYDESRRHCRYRATLVCNAIYDRIGYLHWEKR